MEENKNKSNTLPTGNDVTSGVPIDQFLIKGREFENTSDTPEDLQDRWLRWKCLVCGFVYEGREPLTVCPKCGNTDQDMFDDAS